MIRGENEEKVGAYIVSDTIKSLVSRAAGPLFKTLEKIDFNPDIEPCVGHRIADNRVQIDIPCMVFKTERGSCLRIVEDKEFSSFKLLDSSSQQFLFLLAGECQLDFDRVRNNLSNLHGVYEYSGFSLVISKNAREQIIHVDGDRQMVQYSVNLTNHGSTEVCSMKLNLFNH